MTSTTLRQLGQAYAEMTEKVSRIIEELPDSHRKRLRKQLEDTTDTNCWFAVYRVAPIALEELNYLENENG